MMLILMVRHSLRFSAPPAFLHSRRLSAPLRKLKNVSVFNAPSIFAKDRSSRGGQWGLHRSLLHAFRRAWFRTFDLVVPSCSAGGVYHHSFCSREPRTRSVLYGVPDRVTLSESKSWDSCTLAFSPYARSHRPAGLHKPQFSRPSCAAQECDRGA